MTLYSSKPLISSFTFWGGVASIVPVISSLLTQVAGIPGIPPQIQAILAGAGGLVAILGRVAATKRIDGLVSTK